MGHKRLAASASSRWLKCTGSIRLIEDLKRAKKIPEKSTNPAAELGTAVHYVIEQDLLKNKKADEFLGKSIKVEGMTKPVKIAKKQINDAKVCISYAKRQRRRSKGKLHAEKSYDLSDIYKAPIGGTADITITADKILEIGDYKNGKTFVEVNGNTQLRIYALGAWYYYRDQYDFEKIKITIIQPNGQKNFKPVSKDEWIRTEEFSLKDLLHWERKVLIVALNEIQSNKDKLVPDENNQCYWCEAKAHCFARKEKKEKLRYDVTSKLNLIPISETGVLPEPETLTEQELANAVSNADPVIKFYNDCKKLALKRIEDKINIPGWDRVPKQGNRKIKDEKLLKRKLRKRKILVKDITINSPDRLMGITELQNFLRIEKNWSNEEIEKFMDEVTTRESSGFVLKQVDSASEDFAEFANLETQKLRRRKTRRNRRK